ncbi:Putative DNA-binding protein in cluster with Type I restriction-modification system [uncultured Gammaproteobacteria bacterium]|nr:Putative DNA-binding protein in cluster with Type I restriction-modification system [uncultured Gammaproteobacteria bacterium]VVM25421.1 Putative DNA-binding protein in cluster with Type I restriction-modification system [uncultured Gammaproteobacteria bacterium]
MTPSSNNSETILYTTPDGTVKIDTVFQDEIIRLIQKKMAELFDVKNAQPS